MTATVAPESFDRFAQMKVCPVCRTPVSPDEAACARCGLLVHKPRHEDFPPAVKWFAAWEAARAHWHPWISEQEFWERLVCSCVNGRRNGFSQPNPFGISISAPIERCLPLVVPIALGWRAAGAPFEREQFRLSTPA